jgi:hypothetical protein
LERRERQAAAVVLREIRPGYILPVGVWNVRESVRAAMRTKPVAFDTFSQALEFACRHLAIPMQIWKRGSTLIRNEMFQRRLNQFLVS